MKTDLTLSELAEGIADQSDLIREIMASGKPSRHLGNAVAALRQLEGLYADMQRNAEKAAKKATCVACVGRGTVILAGQDRSCQVCGGTGARPPAPMGLA